MKKKTLLTLMIVAISIIVFGTLSASAATSGYYTYTVSNGKATITDCTDCRKSPEKSGLFLHFVV